MKMFDRDLEILMDDLRGMQKHYQITDWEAFVFIRKPDCPESYVVKYAAANDTLAKQIVQLHAQPSTSIASIVDEIVELLKPGRSAREKRVYKDTVAAIITRHLPVPAAAPDPGTLYWTKDADGYPILDAVTAAATTSPETPVGGEPQKCLKCGHSKASPDDGLCDELLPYVKKEPFGMEMCGCKCEFAAPVATTADNEGEEFAKIDALRLSGCNVTFWCTPRAVVTQVAFHDEDASPDIDKSFPSLKEAISFAAALRTQGEGK